MTFVETAEMLAAGGIVLFLYAEYHRLKFKHLLKQKLEGIETELKDYSRQLEKEYYKIGDRLIQSLADRMKTLEYKSHEEHNTLATGITEALTGISHIGKLLCAQSKSQSEIFQFQTKCLQSLIRALYPVFVDTYEDFMENDDFERGTAYAEILKELNALSEVQSTVQTISFKKSTEEEDGEEQNA